MSYGGESFGVRPCFIVAPIVLGACMVACLCHFVISFFRLFAWRYGAAPRRNNAKRKDEITKKRQAK